MANGVENAEKDQYTINIYELERTVFCHNNACDIPIKVITSFINPAYPWDISLKYDVDSSCT